MSDPTPPSAVTTLANPTASQNGLPTSLKTDCRTCQHATEHGWWGDIGGKVHCPTCHATTGPTRPHCCACHRTFTSDHAAELHRIQTDTPGRRTCADPATITTKAGDPKLKLRADGLWSGAGEYVRT